MPGGWLGRGQIWVYAFHSCCPQNCSQLIQTIEDTGTIMREVRDLEEQVRPGGGRAQQGRPGDREAVGPDLANGWGLSPAH